MRPGRGSALPRRVADTMFRHFVRLGLAVVLAWGCAGHRARAQAPTYDTGLPPRPGGGTSALGSTPGSGPNVMGPTPGGGTAVLSNGDVGGQPISGRVGATV